MQPSASNRSLLSGLGQKRNQQVIAVCAEGQPNRTCAQFTVKENQLKSFVYKKMLNLKAPISQLTFGNPKENERVQNILIKEGISTLEQLCQKSKAELQSIDKIGDITVMRIVNNLEKCGLHLGMSPFEINMYNRRKCREIVSRESFVTELERLLEEGNGDIRFVDRDLMLDDYAPEEDGEDGGECALHLSLNIHHNLHLPEKEAETIDWEARFYDIAKEEFLRQNRVFSDDEVRAHLAVAAASTFVEAMKAYQSKEKSNQ